MFTVSEKPIYLSKQSKLATNFPISFIFNFWSRDMLRDHNFKAQEDLKIYFRGKLHVIPGIHARDIANQSNTSLTRPQPLEFFLSFSFVSVIFGLIGRFLVLFHLTNDCKNCWVRFQKFHYTPIPERKHRDIFNEHANKSTRATKVPPLRTFDPTKTDFQEAYIIRKIRCKILNPLYLLFERQL